MRPAKGTVCRPENSGRGPAAIRGFERAGRRELRMPFPQDWSSGMLEMMLAVVAAKAELSKRSRFWRWCLPGRGLGWWEVFDRL
jgi:hypothetical protein